MNIYLFYHSVISDWNHGNAHFLRGIMTVLMAAGHKVSVYEPITGWSFKNLLNNKGIGAVKDFYKHFPDHQTNFYVTEDFDPDHVLKDADLVIVHEWNDHELVKKIGEHKLIKGKYLLFFHDTHHRSVTEFQEIQKYDLTHYDGVLAFGNVIRDIYIRENICKNAWTWHEAADSAIFKPTKARKNEGDLVWIGNWGDDERTEELIEFIIEPVKRLGIKAKFYGVRYPSHAIRALKNANIEYGGWLPNYKVPEIFSRYRVTVHVPRRPYVQSLPGIPTIRPFEAMACGIPLVTSPWNDSEGLFRVNQDYLLAKNGHEMTSHLEKILSDPIYAALLAKNALETISSRHTCIHRVEQLMHICEETREMQKEKVFVYLNSKKYEA